MALCVEIGTCGVRDGEDMGASERRGEAEACAELL